jgi:hypothetical protein
MNTKLKKEGFKCLSLLISCWRINEKIHPLVGVNIPKPLQLKRETCPSRIDGNKDHLSSKWQLSHNPMRKSSPQNQINLNEVNNDNICQHANTIN